MTFGKGTWNHPTTTFSFGGETMFPQQIADTITATNKSSSLINAVSTTGISINNNVIDNVVTFNVGGRIFQIRRTLLDSYPDTMLARSASDLWKEQNEITSSTATATTTNCADKPIFIDRDSTRFACVLDFMRDSCSIDLPVNITKESFLRELQYFGFDMTAINSDCITYNIPTYNAIVKVGNLHQEFQTKTMEKLKRSKDYTILSYICFCLTVKHVNLSCTIQRKDNTIILPPSAQKRIGTSSLISASSLSETFYTLESLCKHFSIIDSGRAAASTTFTTMVTITNNVAHGSGKITDNVTEDAKSAKRAVMNFNKYLAVYGLECTSIVKNTIFPYFVFQLKQTE
jgi:BTB/POZ domain